MYSVVPLIVIDAILVELSMVSGKELFRLCSSKYINSASSSTELVMVTVIDSSCCGMAGSFGYEKSHYQLSMNIAELRLFPTIREKTGEFTLTASGFSCRHQLEHGTGIIPKHPIEVLSEAISTNIDR